MLWGAVTSEHVVREQHMVCANNNLFPRLLRHGQTCRRTGAGCFGFRVNSAFPTLTFTPRKTNEKPLIQRMVITSPLFAASSAPDVAVLQADCVLLSTPFLHLAYLWVKRLFSASNILKAA